MMTRIRREGESIRALYRNHYPTPGTWTEDVYWLAVWLHTHITQALKPPTPKERAAASVELLTGTPDEAGAIIAPPAPPDKKDGEE